MNIKAIVASLVLGSSSAALAAPTITSSASAQVKYGTTTTVVRDRGDMRPVGWRLPVHRPVTLASGLRFAKQGRAFITVGSQRGQFGKLEINAAGGRTYIQQVYVEFANGQEQVMRGLNRTLTGNQSLTLDLDGDRRAIRRVVVYGTDINSGFRRAPGAFSVIAS